MTNSTQNLSLLRNLKIALFHLGSGLADVLMTGVWNRIMISDLGMAATPVSFLASLRYFLAPLGIWAGGISDRQTVGGFRRLFWVWLGRLMMVLSTFSIGWGTSQFLVPNQDQNLSWIAIIIGSILFSFGNALSGTTFLALIYDRATPEQRGRSVGIVWTFLLIGFTLGGILFGILLRPKADLDSGLSFTADSLFQLFIIAGIMMGTLWFFSVLGEERRQSQVFEDKSQTQQSFKLDFKLVWNEPSLRFFLIFLVLSMLFAFSQDAILEPFAGDVFDMDASRTSRFSAYWGSASILSTILFLVLSRKNKRITSEWMSRAGVIVLVISFALFALSAFLHIGWIIMPNLLVLGLGLGIWNVGTLGLMMDLSPSGRAGTFLGFWTVAVTLARGFGITYGGLLRDVSLHLSGDPALSYGFVFSFGLVGLLFSLWALAHVNYRMFNPQITTSSEQILAGALDS